MRTVAAIKATGKFNDVQLDVIPDVEGVRILLVLQPGYYFALYEFPGAKGFPYSRLLQVANYPPDGPTPPRCNRGLRIAEQVFPAKRIFSGEGDSAYRARPAHGIVNVTFDIVLGKHARFGAVTLEGATPEQTALLQAKLKSKIARLRSSAIRQGKTIPLKTIQNATVYMQNALVKQDHLGAQVQMIGAEYDPPLISPTSASTLSPDHWCGFRSTGAHVWKATQRKLLPLYQQVGVDDELVQEGRRNLISYFESKGFFDAAVEATISQQGTAETIQYKITKGSKHKVASVSIRWQQNSRRPAVAAAT